MNRSTRVGQLLSWVVAITPVFIVLVFAPRPEVTSAGVLLDNLGRLLGLVGISLYAWNLILSARIPFIERQFGGLDKLYRVHHIIGGLAFIALLIHPLLITARYALISFASAYQFLIPNTEDIALQAGKVAVGGMVVVLFITFYIWVSHERFVWIHRLTGALFAVAVYHAFFVRGSRVLAVTPLAWYLGSLSAVALVLFMYRYVFKSVRPRRKFTVEDIKDLGGAWQLTLCPVSRTIDHRAGQFVFITFTSSNLPQQTHPFTISSGESEDSLRFTIKDLGDFTSQLGNLHAGDNVFVEGPYGTFNYQAVERSKQIWVAGGIGITPFLAMARSLSKDDGIDAHLFYSVTDASQAYFADELVQLAKASGGLLRFTLHDSSKKGFLTADTITAEVADALERELMICGPGSMMKAVKQQFADKGMPKQHMQSEEFSFL